MKKPLLITVGALVIAGPAVIAFTNLGSRLGLSTDFLVAGPANVEHGDSVSKVHGSIRVGKGERAGALKNVNGSISLDEEAEAESIKVVNGSIRIDENAVVESSVSSVNGSVSLAAGAKVGEDVRTVNGRIRAAEGVAIDGDVESVNGPIELTGATAGSLTTTNGNVELAEGAVVLGDLTVRKPQSVGFQFGKQNRPKIVIGENAEVRGNLHFDQEVELVVHDSATIGEITGVAPVRN